MIKAVSFLVLILFAITWATGETPRSLVLKAAHYTSQKAVVSDDSDWGSGG